LALKRTLYGLTQIEESPVKGIDSSAWVMLVTTYHPTIIVCDCGGQTMFKERKNLRIRRHHQVRRSICNEEQQLWKNQQSESLCWCWNGLIDSTTCEDILVKEQKWTKCLRRCNDMGVSKSDSLWFLPLSETYHATIIGYDCGCQTKFKDWRNLKFGRHRWVWKHFSDKGQWLWKDHRISGGVA
jgi:hypothetical protein